ncbi:MAG: transposase [Hyphomicrobiales bacterium]
MLKALFLQHWYSLSDEGLEALADRLSFRRFCGFALDDETPTARRCAAFVWPWSLPTCPSACLPSWTVSSTPRGCSSRLAPVRPCCQADRTSRSSRYGNRLNSGQSGLSGRSRKGKKVIRKLPDKLAQVGHAIYRPYTHVITRRVSYQPCARCFAMRGFAAPFEVVCYRWCA